MVAFSDITPDLKHGIGKWSEDDILYLLKEGGTPDGDFVGGAMAEIVRNTARLTDGDRRAIAAYLKSLPAVSHQVPGPFGPNDKATTFVSVVISAGQYNGLQPGK